MISAIVVIAAVGVALFIGLCAGAGIALALHQREFAEHKAAMWEMLESRDTAMATLCHAVHTAHQDLDAMINQTAELSAMNARILAALCKTSAADAFSVTLAPSNRKH